MNYIDSFDREKMAILICRQLLSDNPYYHCQSYGPFLKILFFQTGNYAEAYTNLNSGEAETYRNQRSTVDYVAQLAMEHEVTTVARCDTPHDLELAPNLRSIGVREADLDTPKTTSLLDQISPDVMILRFPHLAALDYTHQHQIPTLPCFADLFQRRPGLRGLRDRMRFAGLRRRLSGPNVRCVANHSLNASRSVAKVLGYPADRTVPWDWAQLTCSAPPKSGVVDPKAPRLFYAGALSEAKGLGEMLEALDLLNKQGIIAQLSIAGAGNKDHWQEKAAELDLTQQVAFLGLIANTEVRSQMAAHDIAIVPSRHSYPEGMPKTISEALAARSGLIVSDHPSFAGRIGTGHGAVSFPAEDSAALADAIKSLSEDRGLYAKLSQMAEKTLSDLNIGMEWQTVISSFLADPRDETGWVGQNSLSALENLHVQGME